MLTIVCACNPIDFIAIDGELNSSSNLVIRNADTVVMDADDPNQMQSQIYAYMDKRAVCPMTSVLCWCANRRKLTILKKRSTIFPMNRTQLYELISELMHRVRLTVKFPSKISAWVCCEAWDTRTITDRERVNNTWNIMMYEVVLWFDW